MDNDDNKTVITSNCKGNTQTPPQHKSIFNRQGYRSTANAWQQMLQAPETQHGKMPHAMLKAGGIKIAINMAVADAGVTSDFVLPGVPVTNIADSPLVITLSDGQTLQSTYMQTGRTMAEITSKQGAHQALWEKRVIDAWYVGSAPKHYRCYKFYVPTTGKTRISGRATFYPEHCEIPKET